MKCNRKFYRCSVCGNLVGLIEEGGGELTCCGQPMALLKPNTVDASQEKHVPVLATENGKAAVKIGSAPHPMLPEHSIQWVYVCTENGGHRYGLKPGDKPEAAILESPESVCAVFAYCNLHGLWQAALPEGKACC